MRLTTSEKIDQIFPALAKAQAAIKHPEKNSQNPHFKSDYADLFCVMEAVREPMKDNGLFIIHTTDSDETGTYLLTTVGHTSGQWYASRLKLNPVKNDPQGVGSAMTYARRYSTMAMFGLAPQGEDDDGNAGSTAPGRKAPAQSRGPVQPGSSKPPAPAGAAKPPVAPKGQPSAAPGPSTPGAAAGAPTGAPVGGSQVRMATTGETKILWARLKNELKFNDFAARDYITKGTGKKKSTDLTAADVNVLMGLIDADVRAMNSSQGMDVPASEVDQTEGRGDFNEEDIPY